jgi:branched-chain amino acid transport system permease protein
MTGAQIAYLTTVLIYGAVDIMACLGLNAQFGVAGIANFGFIIYQAAGAYAAGVLSMPPDTANGGFQSYIGGLQLPFPLPWLGAAVAGALVAVPVGMIVRKSMRADYVGVSMLVTAVVLNSLVTDYRPLLNGAAGLALVPAPLSGEFNTLAIGYDWLYVAVGFILCAAVFMLIRLFTEAPYGRSLRAMRDDVMAAQAIGKNTEKLRMSMLVFGGAIGGLSGGLLVSFISVWAPSAWTYPETIILIAAIIAGGRGNQFGVVLGALLVPVGFLEATRYIPQFGPAGLVPALEWVVTGLLILLFLWFRPQGAFPERRRKLSARLPLTEWANSGGRADG